MRTLIFAFIYFTGSAMMLAGAMMTRSRETLTSTRRRWIGSILSF